MKTIGLILLVFALSFNSEGQISQYESDYEEYSALPFLNIDNNIKPKCSLIVIHNGMKTAEKFYFNRNKYIAKIDRYDSKGLLSELISFSYNKNNLLEKKISKDISNNSNKIETYKYDSENRIIEYFQKVDNKIVLHKQVFFINDTIIEKIHRGQSLLLPSEIVIRKINKKLGGSFVWEKTFVKDTNSLPIKTIEYEYDLNGRMISQLNKGSNQEVLFINNYFFDKRGKRYLEEVVDNDGALLSRTYYYYNSDSDQVKSYSYRSIKDSILMKDERFVYLKQKLMKVAKFDLSNTNTDDSNRQLKGDWRIAYYNNGRLVRIEFFEAGKMIKLLTAKYY